MHSRMHAASATYVCVECGRARTGDVISHSAPRLQLVDEPSAAPRGAPQSEGVVSGLYPIHNDEQIDDFMDKWLRLPVKVRALRCVPQWLCAFANCRTRAPQWTAVLARASVHLCSTMPIW